MQLLGMLTSRNFAGLSLLTSEINPENFRLISQRLAIHEVGLPVPWVLLWPSKSNHYGLGEKSGNLTRRWQWRSIAKTRVNQCYSMIFKSTGKILLCDLIKESKVHNQDILRAKHIFFFRWNNIFTPWIIMVCPLWKHYRILSNLLCCCYVGFKLFKMAFVCHDLYSTRCSIK